MISSLLILTVLLKMEGSLSNVAPEIKSVTRPTSSPKASKRLSDSITNFTVQCANCLKWRFIPTKEKYEQIRETIVEQPFVCKMAHEWRPEITCDVEPDLVKDDGSWRWAIDKPSIPKPPPGWQRILRLRAEGGTKFSDVYVWQSIFFLVHLDKALSYGNVILTSIGWCHFS